MEFIDYLKYKEAELISTIGEQKWLKDKIYSVNEILEFINVYLTVKPPAESVHEGNELPMIDNVHIKSVLQKYDADDGRPDKLWTVGDNTTIGKIIEFKYAHAGENMYALTDTPSEWQAKNGMQHGWAWVFQLQPSQ